MVSDENLWAMCMLRVSLRACCTPVKMEDLPPRMCQESCVPCLARNGNIRAPCIPLMVDPLRGARPASSAARQEALSLRGWACSSGQATKWGMRMDKTITCHDISWWWGWRGNSKLLNYSIYIHIIYISPQKSPAKRCQKIPSIPATPPGCGNEMHFHGGTWRFTIGIATPYHLGAKVRASATLSRHNAKSMAGP